MVQKEYTERLHPSSSTNSLSVFTKSFGNVSTLFHIPSSCFFPKPKVMSSLIVFTAYNEGTKCNPDILEALLRMSFMAKRKKIINSWKLSHLDTKANHVESGEVLKAAERINFPTEERADRIDAENYLKLANEISNQKQW